VANVNDNTVTVLLGDGNGTFTPTAVSPATGSEPRSIVVGDFKGDGNLGLAVVNYNHGTVTVLLGDGTGNFTPTATGPAVGTYPMTVAVDDFNGDGILDLAVASSNSENPGANPGEVTALLGNGDGTFKAGQLSRSRSHCVPHLMVYFAEPTALFA